MNNLEMCLETGYYGAYTKVQRLMSLYIKHNNVFVAQMEMVKLHTLYL